MRPGVRIRSLPVKVLNLSKLFFAQFSDVPICRHSFPHNSILPAILNRISPFRIFKVVYLALVHLKRYLLPMK